jgi:hypothetical protein
VLDLESRGKLENRIAIGAFVAGGAALATGVVMLILNQPRHVRLEESGRRIGLVPSRDGVGLSFSF